MKVGILVIGHSIEGNQSIYIVVADQLKMLLDAGINVKLMINGNCCTENAFGAFLDKRIEWSNAYTNFCTPNRMLKMDLGKSVKTVAGYLKI